MICKKIRASKNSNICMDIEQTRSVYFSRKLLFRSDNLTMEKNNYRTKKLYLRKNNHLQEI